MKAILFILLGLVVGSILTYFVTKKNHHFHDSPTKPYKNKLKVELTRFKIIDGKKEVFNKWMKFHNDHHLEMIKTLNRENMYFESIFLDETEHSNTFYWLSIEGENGQSVLTSKHEVDEMHINFAKEVIDKESKYNLKTEFVLMPYWLENEIKNWQDSVDGE